MSGDGLALLKDAGDWLAPGGRLSWLGWLMVLAAGLAGVGTQFSRLLDTLARLWGRFIRPLLRSPAQRRVANTRRNFAKHLWTEIDGINRAEAWWDSLFTELEAEVETEGGRRSWLPFRRSLALRREPSLSRALERSTERLILLEGNPGAGKSVAMRHIALRAAERAMRSDRADTLLPVYVNLRSLVKPARARVDHLLIRKFVWESLNRLGDKAIAAFLKSQFDAGLSNGTWLFLFDSFDEIPEVLSSIENDEIVLAYSVAIDDFLSGMNNCRGIIASRDYRGPRRFAWCKFTLLDLTPARQAILIRQAFAGRPDRESELFAGLEGATENVRAMTRNPLLLSLLCERVRDGAAFPETAFKVFEDYVAKRLERDKQKIEQRFGMTTSAIRGIAERVAYTMTADEAIGLSPKRSELIDALRRQGGAISVAEMVRALDALESMKLAADRDKPAEPLAVEFSFVHRRVQEYFATAVIVAEPSLVPPDKLLGDARWRETAIVLCLTGRAAAFGPIVERASQSLRGWLEALRLPPRPHAAGSPFTWPRGCLHMLAILQAGLGKAASPEIDQFRSLADALLVRAYNEGDLLDRKLVLEVVGVVPGSRLLTFIDAALGLGSNWLNDIIFQQAAKLSSVSTVVTSWLRAAVIKQCMTGGTRSRRASVVAYAARLPPETRLKDIVEFMTWIPAVDTLLLIVGACALMASTSLARSWPIILVLIPDAVLLWSRKTFYEIVGMRGLFGGMAVLSFVLPGKNGDDLAPAAGLAALLMVYGVLWCPAAIFCANRGSGVKPRHWLLAPAIVGAAWVQALLRAARKALGNLTGLPAEVLRRLLRWWKLLLAAGVGGGAVWSAIGLFPGIGNGLGDAASALGGIIPPVLGLAVLGFLGFGLVAGVRDSIKSTKDQRVIERFFAAGDAGFTGEAIVAMFRSIKEKPKQVAFLQRVAKRGGIEPSAGGERALRLLGAEMTSSELRDEVFRLAEQLNTARKL